MAIETVQVIQGQQQASNLTYDSLKTICDKWHRDGQTISFTNGCFDVLHEGHMELLREARARSDRLVIALNVDEWITQHKGPGRPLQTAAIRCAVAHCVSGADLSLVFNDETVERLLEIVKPEFYIIGSDYRDAKIVGAEHCGQVLLMERIPGISTTATITRVKQADVPMQNAGHRQGEGIAINAAPHESTLA